MTRGRIIGTVVCIVLLAASCGDDSDSSEGDSAATTVDVSGDSATSSEGASPDDGNGGDGDGGEPGDVTIETDPGQGVVEVDGETIVVTWDEARFKSCEITETNIFIEFSLDDGRDLTIRGGPLPSWSAIAYFSPDDREGLQYEMRFPDNASLGLSDTALSMEGDAAYLDGFAPADDEAHPATIAVNCEGTE